MRENTTARTFIRDYERRGILPDRDEQVAQGRLKIWLVCNSYAAEVCIGKVTMAGESLYLNTYSAQEIADDICPRKGLELAIGIAALSGDALNEKER